jgi:sirohydrochlorin cobaltochelatase
VEDPERYAEVRAELARGLTMVTGLPVVMHSPPGWIGVACADEEMAVWLLRAIVVENVMVRREGAVLYLPAGARFTLEGEIKNVVTAVAKTYHYWTQHLAARDFGPAG